MPHSVACVARRDNPDSIPNSVNGLSQEWVAKDWSEGKGKEVLPHYAKLTGEKTDDVFRE